MLRCKRISALLAAAAMLLITVGCGDESTGVYVLDDAIIQPEYLSFFSNTNISDNDVAKYWSDRFMEAYNKQVYIDYDGAAYYDSEGLSYRELLKKRMESSAPDDLYIINAEDVLEFEKKGYWMDLSDLDFVDNLSEAALYQSTYNGKVFSVPLSFTGFGFYWNVDLLREHGLEVPGNLNEFLEVCEKLKGDGVLPYGSNKGYGLTVPAMCAGLSELYASDNLEQRQNALNSGETPISDYMRAGYEFLALMLENGYLDPEQALQSTPWGEDLELFSAGKCAFVCTQLGNINNMPQRNFETKMTGVPVLENGCVSVYGASSRLCVNPNSKHLDTALQFVEMVGTPEALERSATLDNAMSSAKTSVFNCSEVEEDLVLLLGQHGQIPNQDFSLHFNTWESIRDVARELCGGATVEQACNMLDEKQQSELRQYGIE